MRKNVGTLRPGVSATRRLCRTFLHAYSHARVGLRTTHDDRDGIASTTSARIKPSLDGDECPITKGVTNWPPLPIFVVGASMLRSVYIHPLPVESRVSSGWGIDSLETFREEGMLEIVPMTTQSSTRTGSPASRLDYDVLSMVERQEGR